MTTVQAPEGYEGAIRARVSHREYGVGAVNDVDVRMESGPVYNVSFDNGTNKIIVEDDLQEFA